ncbi:MAG: DUF1611 domain-containing protein [Candidatus Sumerlaeia bacterium]
MDSKAGTRKNFRAIKRRIVALAEKAFNFKSAKTAVGVIRYSFHDVVAVIDSEKAGLKVRDVIEGLDRDIPIVPSLDEAMRYEPDCLLIGVAPRGGALPPEWREIIKAALERGLHVYNGLHSFLTDDRELRALARRHHAIIWDVRRPEPNLPVALGLSHSTKSYIVETVGSDCSVGKMTAALEVMQALRRKGLKAEFVATGQTGILISGWGQPVDAIVGDFMAGAVEHEVLKLDGQVDVILIEGQGSLLHPGYSSVTLALLHGGAPDALILCHQSTRHEIAGGYNIPIPPLSRLREIYETAASWIHPTQTLAVSLNTYGLSDDEARADIARVAQETGLPTTDPVRFDPDVIADAIVAGHERHTANDPR